MLVKEIKANLQLQLIQINAFIQMLVRLLQQRCIGFFIWTSKIKKTTKGCATR